MLQLRYGFKADAERHSKDFREALDLPLAAPLSARAVARHLEIPIKSPLEIPGVTPELANRLLRPEARWCAVMTAGSEPEVYVNTAKPEVVQERVIMHEIAHLICRHRPTRFELAGFAMRSYDAVSEGEADWLGVCLQVSRPGLLEALKRGWSTAKICAHFGVDEKALRFRRNGAGVDIEYRRWVRKHQPSRDQAA